MTAEKRADRAARARIRYAMTQAFGDRVAHSANLYHRSDGWYYQPHRGTPEHLGATVAEVAAELRQIAIIRHYEHWH